MSKIFKKLFFNKKKAAAPTSTVETITQLGEKEEQLLKKQDYLEKQIQEQIKLAKENSSSNKRIALQALKRKRLLEKQQQHLDGVLQTLAYQKQTLDNAAVNSDVLGVLASTSKTLKNAHNGMNIEKVQDMMEEISDQFDIGKEISEAISNQGMIYDEDELLAELDELKEASENEEVLQFPNQITDPLPTNDVLITSETKEKKETLIAQMA